MFEYVVRGSKFKTEIHVEATNMSFYFYGEKGCNLAIVVRKCVSKHSLKCNKKKKNHLDSLRSSTYFLEGIYYPTQVGLIFMFLVFK
jgi:CRISPR/Cas system CSM-associated protein Csm3 (group 7 of RAMP superfamily)